MSVSLVRTDRPVTMMVAKPVPLSLVVALFAGAALLRILVGYQPHSGQDNYHGAQGAYGGDFEAQRHWMELTLHLPVGEWYWYDLEYWGLDYPPLSAYQSWLCGYLSSSLVGPETVAFETSRGYEDPTHKAFMRGTVLVLDLLLYGTAAWVITKRLSVSSKTLEEQQQEQHTTTSLWSFAVAMSQPAILLIDHGHFQYNTTALGLSLWAFYFMTANHFESNCVVGSIFFCLALSFKQMTLYYAPVVGCYLLGRCLAEKQYFGRRFLVLGCTVIVCFAVLWWPFVLYGPQVDGTASSGDSRSGLYLKRIHHVLRRIIPVQRGLFESKVSNLWCALSVRPLRLKHRIPQDWQPILALGGTALLMGPSCYKLFRVGQASASGQANQAANLQRLLWGTTQCALAFFLLSFQVHEKSLLLALAPASFLSQSAPLFVDWFAVVTTWTLWPLLVIDRLQVAYGCTVGIFLALLLLRNEFVGEPSATTMEPWLLRNWNAFRRLSWIVMVLLHVADLLYEPPDHLPDLFPVLWSIAGCGFCCVAYLMSGWYLFSEKEKAE